MLVRATPSEAVVFPERHVKDTPGAEDKEFARLWPCESEPRIARLNETSKNQYVEDNVHHEKDSEKEGAKYDQTDGKARIKLGEPEARGRRGGR